ncbi:hypothetical protein SELMODRAFT_427232 [Selaginella moellendorffii]|uniref:Uncharacterized protein n=1 Tax=Selaginella moellendorffii TaxID=88036 RepID=D8SYY9_SELML|nr:hypothetical protein SELMODRAFT_427232 [Selaginella moellendorffii]
MNSDIWADIARATSTRAFVPGDHHCCLPTTSGPTQKYLLLWKIIDRLDGWKIIDRLDGSSDFRPGPSRQCSPPSFTASPRDDAVVHRQQFDFGVATSWLDHRGTHTA